MKLLDEIFDKFNLISTFTILIEKIKVVSNNIITPPLAQVLPA